MHVVGADDLDSVSLPGPATCTDQPRVRVVGQIFCFSAFFLKDFHKYVSDSILLKIDPDLGTVTIGAELTRLDTNYFGTEVQGYFLRVVDVAACMARTWHELGTVDLGAELNAVDLGAELGANYYDTELWKLINFNFYHGLGIEKCD